MNGVFTSSTPSFSSALSLNAAYHQILRTDGGERIFRAFSLDVGKRHVSPFRTDAAKKNLSVSRHSNGNVVFKDFVSGVGGTFPALLHAFGYHTFEAQMRFAAPLYGLIIKDERKDRKHEATTGVVPSPHIPTLRTTPVAKPPSLRFYRVTALECDEFSDEECHTLAKLSANIITKEVLQRFGIKALRSFSDEGRTDKGFSYGGKHHAAYTLVAPAADGNFYAYCYYNSEIHSPFPNKAKNFHLKLNEYISDVKFSLGLSELRPKEAAYLVEGIKDCLILLAKGYNAFTLGGVQHRLHPHVITHLTENENTLQIVFDTDFAGLDAAHKLMASLHSRRTDLSVQHIVLPRLQQQTTKDAPKPTHNDVADYVSTFGFDDLLTDALLPAQPLERVHLVKGDMSVPALKLRIRDKLSNDPAAVKSLTLLLDQCSRLALRAPTGCGKTYTLLRHVAQKHHTRTGGITVLAVPTIALAEQARTEYADLNPVLITGNDSDLHRLYGNDAHTISCVLTTYDSAPRLVSLITQSTTLFAVDEMHKLVQDYEYRSPAMRNMMTLIKHAPRVLCMSATPELLFSESPLNFTFCDIEVEEKRPLFFNRFAYTKRDEALVRHICSIRMQQTDTLLFCQVNSKTLLKRTKKLLTRHCGIAENDIDIIHADTLATSPEYRSLTETSRFSRPIILSTKILDSGVNVLNTGRVQVLLLDENNEDTIIQTANRFRRAEDIQVVLLTKENKNKKKGREGIDTQQQSLFPLPSTATLYHQAQMMAQMTTNAFNDANGRNTNADCSLGKRSSSRLFDRHLFFDSTHHRWTTDETALLHRLHTLRLMMTTPEQLGAALAEAGFMHREENRGVPETIPAAMNEAALDCARLESALEQERATETIFTLLENSTIPFFAALVNSSRSSKLKDTLHRFHPEALLLLWKQHPDTVNIVATHGDLLREQRTLTLVRYYTEARALGFDFKEALHLVRMNTDARKWTSFTQLLAMKQREALHLAGLTDSILSKHDRMKLQREEEIRRCVANTAHQGCTLVSSNGTERHIPNSIRSKRAIAERVNAYQTTLYRVTQQSAGELVSAMFHVHYVRERVQGENGKVVQSGTYRFIEHKQGLKRKTLAEFVAEYGLDGASYSREWLRNAEAEAGRYAEHQRREQSNESSCVQEVD